MDTGHCAFLALTVAMKEALIRKDLEGFSSLVEQREAVVAAIGNRAPTDAGEVDCLRQAAALDAEVTALAGEAWNALIAELRQVKAGQRATAAYQRHDGHERAEGPQYVDRSK